MAFDLIKQYLIGIGFQIDDNSIQNAENSINETEEKIKKFNNQSNKGFLETDKTIKDLFSLFKSTSLGTLFPDLQKPVNNLIKDIKLAEKSYKSLLKSKDSTKKEDENLSNKDKSIDNSKKHNKNLKDTIKSKKDVVNKKPEQLTKTKEKNPPKYSFLDSFIKDIVSAKSNLKNLRKNSTKDLKDIEDATGELASKGGKSILGFSLKSISGFALVAGAIVSLISLCKKLFTSLSDLGVEDIGYEKMARQLWTTKETARDVDTALKTLGVSMQDLWLSPTLLKQFNQLREDSAKLRLPDDFKDNIAVVQGLSLEFKRLRQFVGLTFKWIGSYILKYCAGPLFEIKKGLHKFNDGLLKAIPYIGKIIGSTIGIILRCILMIGKILSPIFSIISCFIKFIINLIDKIPAPIKNILKIIGIIAGIIIAGPVAAIMLVIAAIDDLLTFLRGGKSVIGNVFGFFKEEGSKAIDSIKGKFKGLKEAFNKGMKFLKGDWDSYLEKASAVLEKIKEKAKKVLGAIKGLFSKGKDKDFITNIHAKVEDYNKNTDKNNPPSYVTKTTSNNSTNMSNSNNKIDNKNVINVYSNGDAKATANEVDRNLTGVQQRNLGGVF